MTFAPRQNEGQYSIRINDQWRVGFEWRGNGAHQVDVVDKHCGQPHGCIA